MLTFLASVAKGDFYDNLVLFAKDRFSNFGIKDIADIFVLSIIIFLFLRFIRGRKAGVLVIGVSVLLLVMLCASLFELNATYYLFSQIFKVGVIAIIIIFQPEIRDALDRIGTGSINGIMSFGDQKKKRELYHNVIEQIVTAVADLSSTKTGALIVVSRTTKLDEILHTGIKTDAEVSSFLLRNLFFNKAPLHDGAVVIDDGKIAAAGCLLPNTRRTDVDSNLGTRHRAAIGMSEISDAIIIIVSEETGTISIAYECELTRGYTPDTLRKFLTQNLIRQGRNFASDSDKNRS